MDIRQLRYFVGIVEAKSFSRAASRLHVAQPALSLHVRNMETDLGTALLLRTPQGVIPTEAGQLLLERARAIIAAFEDAKRAVAEFDNEPAGEVRLGLPATLGELLSVPLILAMRERYPKVRLRIAEAMSGYVLDWLFAGRVDLALLYLPVDERGLRSTPVVREELRLFAPPGGVPGHELPAGEAVPLDLIQRLPLVLPSAGHGLRALIDQAMDAEGLDLTAAIEVDSYASIKEIVDHGEGFSILPANAVTREEGRFRTWTIGEPPLSRTVHLARPFDRPASKAAGALEDLCHETLAGLVADGRWRAALVQPGR